MSPDQNYHPTPRDRRVFDDPSQFQSWEDDRLKSHVISANNAYLLFNRSARQVMRRRLRHDAEYGDETELDSELSKEVSMLHKKGALRLAMMRQYHKELARRRGKDAKLDGAGKFSTGYRSEAMIQTLIYRQSPGNCTDPWIFLPSSPVGDGFERRQEQSKLSRGVNSSYDGWLIRRASEPNINRESTKTQIKTSEAFPGVGYEKHILVLSAEKIANGLTKIGSVQQAIIDEVNGVQTIKQMIMINEATDRINEKFEDHLNNSANWI